MGWLFAIGALFLVNILGWQTVKILGIVVVAIVIICQFANHSGTSNNETKPKTAAEKKHSEIGDQILSLTGEYLSTADHTPEQAREAWAACKELLAELHSLESQRSEHFRLFEAQKPDQLYRIFTDVCRILDWNHYEHSAPLAENLLNFYYEIAFSYSIEPQQQEELINYLKWCCRKDSSCYHGDESTQYRHSVPETFSWDDWDERFLQLLEEGRKKKFAPAIACLAKCYYNYEIVEFRDYDMAFSLYQQAARLGDTTAVYMMGQCYEKGLGTKENTQKAGDCYQYAYNLSKQHGYAEALDNLYTGKKWDKNKYSENIFSDSIQTLIKENLPALRNTVEKYMQTELSAADPKITAIFIRRVLEDVVNSFVECFESQALNDRLDEKITLLRRKGYFTKDISDQAHNIRILGNRGAHNDGSNPITPEEVCDAFGMLYAVVEYYAQY